MLTTQANCSSQKVASEQDLYDASVSDSQAPPKASDPVKSIDADYIHPDSVGPGGDHAKCTYNYQYHCNDIQCEQCVDGHWKRCPELDYACCKNDGRFTVTNNWMAIDKSTELSWMRLAGGAPVPLLDPDKICQQLAHSQDGDAGVGWRIPTLKEWQSIILDPPLCMHTIPSDIFNRMGANTYVLQEKNTGIKYPGSKGVEVVSVDPKKTPLSILCVKSNN